MTARRLSLHSSLGGGEPFNFAFVGVDFFQALLAALRGFFGILVFPVGPTCTTDCKKAKISKIETYSRNNYSENFNFSKSTTRQMSIL